MIAAFMTFTSISLLSGVIAVRLRTSATCRSVLDKIAGVVFTGLAIRLALTKR